MYCSGASLIYKIDTSWLGMYVIKSPMAMSYTTVFFTVGFNNKFKYVLFIDNTYQITFVIHEICALLWQGQILILFKILRLL